MFLCTILVGTTTLTSCGANKSMSVEKRKKKQSKRKKHNPNDCPQLDC